MRQAARTPTSGLSERDEEMVKLCATNLLEDVPALGAAMARHIHEQVPELGGDREALEATRRSCVANLRELCIMLRAGLPATAHETPSDALEYVRFLRDRDVGLPVVHRCYQCGVAMFGAVASGEFERCADDLGAARRMGDAVGVFIWVYVDRVLERLGEEYGGDRRERVPGAEDPAWRDAASAQAAARFLAARAQHLRGEEAVTHARQTAEAVLDRFQAIIEAAAGDERASRRIARADTSVRIVLADEPDLTLTLALAGETIDVTRAGVPAEVELTLSSVDLERIRSEDFNLAMAIAHGRVQVSGPVRKFLRVMPIVRRLPDPETQRGEGRPAGDPPTNGAAPGDDGSCLHPETRALLDRAARHDVQQGALRYAEAEPGHFWSVQCRGVSKSVGADRVLDGLDVGIPEGMITAVLGPSGTGKSVLISHLVGLMVPDEGQVLVQGRSVADLRASQMPELRRRVGVLFQDGALTASLNIFDNVAFPLRQHTDHREQQIAAIVHERLAEVGLDGAGDRMPGELPDDLRRRADLARALVLDPEIVVFDEPDAGGTRLPCELVQQLHAEHGGTYIVITNDTASARRIADYFVVLWQGRVVQSGDRDDMFTSRNPFVRQFLAGRPSGAPGTD